MPTYVYRRQDGSKFEIDQRITEDALETCPTTGQPVERVITGGTGLIFKGSGFYLTDYARKPNGRESGETAKSDAAAKSESATADSPAKESPAKESPAKESRTKESSAKGSSAKGTKGKSES